MNRIIVFALLFLVLGCGPKEGTYDWHIKDRSRFLNENRQACRILKVDDEGCERKVEIEGLITKESTWACFDKHLTPKVGEIYRLQPMTDRKIAWFKLSCLQPSLED